MDYANLSIPSLPDLLPWNHSAVALSVSHNLCSFFSSVHRDEMVDSSIWVFATSARRSSRSPPVSIFPQTPSRRPPSRTTWTRAAATTSSTSYGEPSLQYSSSPAFVDLCIITTPFYPITLSLTVSLQYRQLPIAIPRTGLHQPLRHYALDLPYRSPFPFAVNSSAVHTYAMPCKQLP